MKFIFKTETPTGKWKSFQKTFHYIKLAKKEVGTIDDYHPHEIRLSVIKSDIYEDGNPNCEWKWITLAIKSESLQGAKNYLTSNISLITEKYNLYKFN